MDEARPYAEQGLFPGGSNANYEFVASKVTYGKGLKESTRRLLCDAQTSGGLLIAVATDRFKTLVDRLKKSEVCAARAVGRVTEGDPAHVRVEETLPSLDDFTVH